MTKKKKPKTMNRHKPLNPTDNLMYGMFTLIVVIIIVIATVVLRFFSSSVSVVLSSDIIGLLSGVLSGLLASVIVTWLLDIADCKRKNKMLNKAVDDDLNYLKIWLDELFQGMRDSLSSQNDKSGLRFEALYKLFVEQFGKNKSPELSKEASIGIYVNINMILATIDKLICNDRCQGAA